MLLPASRRLNAPRPGSSIMKVKIFFLFRFYVLRQTHFYVTFFRQLPWKRFTIAKCKTWDFLKVHLSISWLEVRNYVSLLKWVTSVAIRNHAHAHTSLFYLYSPHPLPPPPLSQVLWRNWDKPHAASQISLHLGQEQDLHISVCVFTPEGEQFSELEQPFPTVSIRGPIA